MPRSRQIAFERSSFARAPLEVAEPCVDVRAGEQRVRLDGGQLVLARPGELLLEERLQLGERCPSEEHRAADLVPGVIWRRTSPEAIACSRALRSASSWRVAVARAELGRPHQLPRVGEVGVVRRRWRSRARRRRELVGVAVPSMCEGGRARPRRAARSSSSPSARAARSPRARTSSASASEPVPRSARPSSGSSAARSAGASASSALARSSSDAAAAGSPRSSARSPGASRAAAAAQCELRRRGGRAPRRAGRPARGGSR